MTSFGSRIQARPTNLTRYNSGQDNGIKYIAHPASESSLLRGMTSSASWVGHGPSRYATVLIGIL